MVEEKGKSEPGGKLRSRLEGRLKGKLRGKLEDKSGVSRRIS